MDATKRTCGLLLSALVTFACSAPASEPGWSCGLSAGPGPVPAGSGRAWVAVVVTGPGGARIEGVRPRVVLQPGSGVVALPEPPTGEDGVAILLLASDQAGAVTVSATVEGPAGAVPCGNARLYFTGARLPEAPTDLSRWMR